MAGEKTLEEVMQFDPFSPTEGETEEEQNQGQAQAQEGGEPQPGSKPEPKPGSQTPPSDDEVSGDEEDPPQDEPSSQPPAAQPPTPDLQAQIAQVQALLAQQQRQTQEQGKTEPSAQPAAPKPPRFNLAIPPQLQQAMNSEDPAESGAAMHALVNGVANAIWKEFEGVVQELEQKLTQQMPQIAQQHTQTFAEQQRVAQDFYGTYPMFNLPAMKPIVQQVAQGLAQQQAAMGMPVQWNPQFRDAVANQLFQMFPMLKTQPKPNGQAGAPQTRSKAPKAQSFASGRGTRPTGQSNEDPGVKDIMDTLDLR